MYGGATAVDGYAGREGVQQTWADLIAAAGSTASHSQASYIMKLQANATTDRWQTLRRGVFLFDSTELPAGAILQSANVSFMPTVVIARNFSSSFVLANAPVTAYTSIIAADYARLHALKVEHSDSRVALSSLVGSTRFSFDLNAQAILTLQSTFVSGNAFELGLYFDHDFDETSPVWAGGAITDEIRIGGFSAGDPNWPILTVTFRIGRGYATLQLTGTLANGADTVTADMWAVEVFTQV